MKIVFFIVFFGFSTLFSFGQRRKKEIIKLTKQNDSLISVLTSQQSLFTKEKKLYLLSKNALIQMTKQNDSLKKTVQKQQDLFLNNELLISKSLKELDSIKNDHQFLLDNIGNALPIQKIKGSFVSASFGDCLHVNFVDDKGQNWDFGDANNCLNFPIYVENRRTNEFMLNEKIKDKKVEISIAKLPAIICKLSSESSVKYESIPTIIDIKF